MAVVGAVDGILVGRSVGSRVGMAEDVGVAVGGLVGSDVGTAEDVGVEVGPMVGGVDTKTSIVGADVGESEGEFVMPVVGLIVGPFVLFFFIPFFFIPCFIPFLRFDPFFPLLLFFDFALASGILLSNKPEGKLVGRKVVITGVGAPVGAPVLPIPFFFPLPFPFLIPLPFPLPFPLTSSSVSGEVPLETSEGTISGRTLVGNSVGAPVLSAMGDILASTDGVRGPTLGNLAGLSTDATGATGISAVGLRLAHLVLAATGSWRGLSRDAAWWDTV